MNDRIPDQRMPKWWDKWTNPTVVFTLLGGVVWGSNLNSYVTGLGKNQDSIRETQKAILLDIRSLQFDNAKTTLVLDALVRRMDINLAAIKEHVMDDRNLKNDHEKRFDVLERKTQ